MKFRFIFFSTLLILFTIGVKQNVSAQFFEPEPEYSAGLMLGNPTGITFKYWKNTRNAFSAGLAWSLTAENSISIHGDYVWHHWLDSNRGRLALHYGLGSRLLTAESNSILGARAPFGLSYLIESAPIELFVEIAPVIEVIPDTKSDIMSGLGARFYLKQ